MHPAVNTATATRVAFTLAVLSALLPGGAQRALAQTETVLYSFQGGSDGADPASAPMFDKAGNLYGTTYQGGTYGLGTVWKLTPSGTETVVWSFGGGTDGSGPVSSLVMDKAGNLYGTTYQGGAYSLGTVFKITPSGGEAVLWSFGNGEDGANPSPPWLVPDKEGNFFGTTLYGGAYNLGTVFKITPSGAETVLWNFGSGTDGSLPEGLMLAKNGNLYGTSFSGGDILPYGGTIWELTPSGTETVLHSFNPYHSKDGDDPNDAPVMDKKGNLYGTCHSGDNGSAGGAVWRLTPAGKEKVLWQFNGNGIDGYNPYAGVVMDRKGNLYGVNHGGNPTDGTQGGTVWELTRSRTLTILHTFAENGADGYGPVAAMVMDSQGNLYGTTTEGGAYGNGAVFEVTP
ncbi:MAG TPA: choice-of-anchor tandem repeat GloVer-containing protein [Rhizomicrobium sp.]|jgi:uncharacterized repeat protein (TIGR03803 family)|nr:choice-of-anchor tandem repeat GloVer-containing protein [Rhizomicrobium sp.]